MATLTVTGSGFDGFVDLKIFVDADSYARSSSSFEVYNDRSAGSEPISFRTTATGYGFRYSDFGYLASGRVTAISATEFISQDITQVSIAGISADASALSEVALTESEDDDRAYFLSLFAGNDTMTGADFPDQLNSGAGDDALSGNGGDDTLSGGSGNDKFGGGAGSDTIDGGAGSDTAFFRDKTTAVVATLNGANDIRVRVGGVAEDTLRNVENLTGGSGDDRLTGDGLVNTLDGSTGNDILDGKAGADTMIGGLGNDTFTVDNVADKVVEANGAGTGTDGVVSSVSFSIANQFVESLLLTGSADIAAFGNNLDNVITGNAGANALTGYLGKDLFLFRAGLSAGNVDTIRDFRVSDDTIGLGTNVFTQAHGSRADGTGTLLSGEFRANTTGLAQDGDDRIIYETDTGKIFYDANGSAAGGAFLFAKVGAGLALTNADFLLA